MIFIFHSLYILVRHLLKVEKNKWFLREVEDVRKWIEEEVNRHTTTYLDAELNIKFDPPVYKQRYEAVQRVLLDERWRKYVHKVVDFGCSDLCLFPFLKHLYGLHEVLAVDIDEDLLRDNIFKIQPLTVDFLRRRSEPLKIDVFAGSISEPDPVLHGIDVVIAIEIIEHLYPDVLEALPYNIFSYIRPKIVIITTPNADFNVLFKDFSGMRHYDHKFEWSREQFEAWAYNIVSRFSHYAVSFIGIGSAPQDSNSKLGHCSQMAVFVKEDSDNIDAEKSKAVSKQVKNCNTAADNDLTTPTIDIHICGNYTKESSFGICTHLSYSKQTVLYDQSNSESKNCTCEIYKLMASIDYPYETNKQTPNEMILYDTQYRINTLGRIDGRFYSDENDRSEIPLEELIWDQDGLFITVPELANILQKSDYKIEECLVNELGKSTLCVIYEPVMENDSSPTTESSLTDYETNDDWKTEEISISDWERDDAEVHNSVWTVNADEKEKIDRVKLQAAEIIHDMIKNLEVTENNLLHTIHQEPELILMENIKQMTNFETSQNSTKIAKVGRHVNYSKNIDANWLADGPSGNGADSDKFVFDKESIEVSAPSRKNFGIKNLDSLSKREAIVVPKRNWVAEDKEPVAGTSNIKKRKRLRKIDDEDYLGEDIKSLAECIVINTLNKIDDVPLIVVEQEPLQLVANPADQNILVVENGDLANNNRDMEGNNYPPGENEVREEHLENVNENVVAQNHEDNVRDDENPEDENENNDLIYEQEVAEDLDMPKSEILCENDEGDITSDTELAFASREALFDPNSKVDLLADFEIPSLPVPEDHLVIPSRSTEEEHVPLSYGVVVIGINALDDEYLNPALPAHADPFPNWLLQLLGADIVEEMNQHDEPHFYCQGDGLGVHPSVVEVDVDTSSSNTSTNNSNDDAETENTGSEQELLSLTEDTVESYSLAPTETVTLQQTASHDSNKAGPSGNDSNDDVFDIADEATPSSSKTKH